jgi:DNA-binding CsgD family transcriptional regulator
MLRDAYAQWLRGGREPLLTGAVTAPRSLCGCALHAALRTMQPILIHGVRDKLSGCDSLYIALDARSVPAPADRSRFMALAHLLLSQLDSVWRKLAAFRLENAPVTNVVLALPRELSAREREILASLSRGSTNHDIAETFAISLFTVKNHVKRIFRKIGVTNRTQAAARFNDALMQSAAPQSASDTAP